MEVVNSSPKIISNGSGDRFKTDLHYPQTLSGCKKRQLRKANAFIFHGGDGGGLDSLSRNLGSGSTMTLPSNTSNHKGTVGCKVQLLQNRFLRITLLIRAKLHARPASATKGAFVISEEAIASFCPSGVVESLMKKRTSRGGRLTSRSSLYAMTCF